MTTRKQMHAVLTQITEGWLDDGVDPVNIVEVLGAKVDELNETMFRSLKAHVRQYQIWKKREEEEEQN